MVELSIAFTASVFLAGILMFLAPCTLPLIPAYLAFVSGVRQDELADPNTRDAARRAIMTNGVAFVIGFSIVFVLFGTLAGFLGGQLGQFRDLLAQIGGAFIILFGLMMLNLINIGPLLRERRLPLPSFLTPGNPASALGIGVIFALGWTPCVGPVLASVLLLASTQATALSGGALLGVFSLGLAVPFLATSFLYMRATAFITRIGDLTKWVSRVGGMFLIFIGILLLTGSFGLTVEYGYKVFDVIGFEGLFDHL